MEMEAHIELCNKYPFYLKENYHGMENNPLPYFIYEPTFNITDDDVVKFSKAISEFWRKLKNIENVEDREEWLRRTFERESENNRTEQVNRVIPLINIQLVG